MYGPGTGFAKKKKKICAENAYLELYEDICESQVSWKHLVLQIMSSGRSFPLDWWWMEASTQALSIGLLLADTAQGDFQLPEGSHHTSEPTQVHPWGALGEGLWVERGCLEGRWGEESGWESTAPRHPWGNYIIYLLCITGFPMVGLFKKIPWCNQGEFRNLLGWVVF